MGNYLTDHLARLHDGEEMFFVLGGGGGKGLLMDAGAGTASTTVKLQDKLPYNNSNVDQQLWVFQDGYIIHKSSGLVLDGTNDRGVTIEAKTPGKASQQWTIGGNNGQLAITNAGRKLCANGPNNAQENFYSPGAAVSFHTSGQFPSFKQWYVLAPSLLRAIVYTTKNRALTVGNMDPWSQTGYGYPQPMVFGDNKYLWYIDESGRIINDGLFEVLTADDQHRYGNIGRGSFSPAFNKTSWIAEAESNTINIKSKPSFALSAYPHAGAQGSTYVDSGGDRNYCFGNPEANWENPESIGFLDIETTSDGITLAVTKDNGLVYFAGSSWQPVPGNVSDALNVVAGSSQFVFYRAEGGHVMKMIATSDPTKLWHHIEGAHLNFIAAGASGAVWGINLDNQIVRWDGGDNWTVITADWQTTTGKLTSLAVVSNEYVWGTNHDREVWFYDGTSWSKKNGQFYAVSVGGDQTVRAVNPAGQLFEYQGFVKDSWSPITGVLKMVSVGSNQITWGLGAASEPYHLRVQHHETNRALRTMSTTGVGNKQYAEALLCAHMCDFAYRTEANARAGLSGYDPSYEMKEWFHDAQTDTQGYLAYSASANTIVVAFRGTESFTDANIDLWQEKTTINGLSPAIQIVKGFDVAYESIESTLLQSLRTLVNSIGVQTIKHIYITGHSLGGALSTFAGLQVAALLSAEYNFRNAGITKLISMAAPPTGNYAWQNYFQGQSGILDALSYQLPNDSVTTGVWHVSGFTIDFAQWDYHQASTIVRLPNDAAFPTAHSLSTYISTLEGLVPEHNVHPLTSLIIDVHTGGDVAPWWKFDGPGTSRTVTFEIGNFDSKKTVSQQLEPQYFYDNDTGTMVGGVLSPGTTRFRIDGIAALNVEDLKKYKMSIDVGGGISIWSKDNWGFDGLKIFANGNKVYDKTGDWKIGPDYNDSYEDSIS